MDKSKELKELEELLKKPIEIEISTNKGPYSFAQGIVHVLMTAALIAAAILIPAHAGWFVLCIILLALFGSW